MTYKNEEKHYTIFRLSAIYGIIYQINFMQANRFLKKKIDQYFF